MKPFQRQLRVPGQMDDLPLIARFLQDNCAEAGVDPAVRFDLELAVEEACTNIIEHAYGGQGGEFELDFEATGADVTFTVLDRGKRFNPDDAADANVSLPVDERRIGGLGIH